VITDQNGESIQINYDGSEPSGFAADNTYFGMDGWEPLIYDNLASVWFAVSDIENVFVKWYQLLRICVLDAPNICFNIFNWV